MNEIRISAEQFRRELTELLSQAGYGGATVVIERHGTPLAALIPYQEYQKQSAKQAEVYHENAQSVGALNLRESSTVYDAKAARIPSAILTLDEAAAYLRTSVETVQTQAEQGEIPGRKLNGSWRFSRQALEQWLQPHNNRTALLAQAGIFAGDAALDEMLAAIYAQRGRPEVTEEEGMERGT